MKRPQEGFKIKAVAKCLLMLWFGTIAAHAQILNFQHIVVIVQENRTPDNLFQGLCTSSSHLVKRCSTTPSSTQYNIQTGYWLDKHFSGADAADSSAAGQRLRSESRAPSLHQDVQCGRSDGSLQDGRSRRYPMRRYLPLKSPVQVR
jgi:phospholipase C